MVPYIMLAGVNIYRYYSKITVMVLVGDEEIFLCTLNTQMQRTVQILGANDANTNFWEMSLLFPKRLREKVTMNK
jgi:hypothetical protein